MPAKSGNEACLSTSDFSTRPFAPSADQGDRLGSGPATPSPCLGRPRRFAAWKTASPARVLTVVAAAWRIRTANHSSVGPQADPGA
jgi:hypothetical protein